jgi:hypothetical protein
VVALQTGTIEWDQPARQSYQAGQPLPIRLRVTNPTTGEREYQLYLGLYDPGTRQLIEGTLQVVAVDNQQSFTVPAQSYVAMEGEVTVDRTNVILALSLYDVAADGVVSQVATLLEGPAPPPSAGGGLEQLIPIVGLGLVAGMMVPMTEMLRERRQ